MTVRVVRTMEEQEDSEGEEIADHDENNYMPKRIRNAELESADRAALERVLQVPPKGKTRFIVRIIRRSTRILDRENIVQGCKGLVDQLRYAKFIPNDDPQTITLEVAQERVKSRKECETIVEIIVQS